MAANLKRFTGGTMKIRDGEKRVDQYPLNFRQKTTQNDSDTQL